MKNIINKMILGAVVAVSGSAYGDFAPIQDRFIPLENQQELNENRFRMMTEQDDVEIAHENGKTTIQISKKGGLDLSKKGGISLPSDYYSYPGYDHWSMYFSNDGRLVELEDESQWFVVSSDVITSLSWLTGDHLAIYPNKDFWRTSKFKLVNHNTGDSIRVDLTRGPLVHSPYAKFVSAVDTIFDSVYLTDGTRWDVQWSDAVSLRSWVASDVIIVGFNSGWSSSSYPAILINVTLNEYVAVKRGY
ncbi:hypothetical protein N9Y92_00860 [Chlamydiales bacterium]|nr:hypothetical protein [Chlamydiales bacterium]